MRMFHVVAAAAIGAVALAACGSGSYSSSGAKTWPPVRVEKGWMAANGLDRSLFSTIVRADGTRQLVAGQWPLYTFSGDAKPGDVNGEGSGGVWFAVGTNAKLVKHAQSSPTTALPSSGY